MPPQNVLTGSKTGFAASEGMQGQLVSRQNTCPQKGMNARAAASAGRLTISNRINVTAGTPLAYWARHNEHARV
jgi:hypothetical protein